MSLSLTEAGKLDATQVLASLGSPAGGLDAEEARRRLAQVGLNAVRSHGARPPAVLARQWSGGMSIASPPSQSTQQARPAHLLEPASWPGAPGVR
jgi:hypothetical protein